MNRNIIASLYLPSDINKHYHFHLAD